MKIPLSWLKEYVEVKLRPAELAHKLTMAGVEIGSIQYLGGKWDNVLIGQISDVQPHPNADRLKLATVDLAGQKETVVCGAPNLRVGDKIAFARVGAELTDPHTGQTFHLKTAKIRGIASSGMVCSEKELGISESHEGILVLDEEAEVGTPLSEFLGEVILDAEVTPNRPDCLSILGIAHEVAALTGQECRLPTVSYPQEGTPIDQQVAVEIKDPDLCGRYCASLISDVKIGESPQWMQKRLIAGGMRPINNVVDVTNYVMLEYGQPLHAFDYQLIRGKKIIVRRAAPGERLVSLDGVERSLNPQTLVIADAERAVAIGGVMGGANSEVAPETTTILLEAASFNPASIHYTSRALGLPSEAAMRFERGISGELTMPAIKRATQLIIETAGGKAAPGLIDVYPAKKEPTPITLTTTKVKRLLGVEFSREQIVNTLTSLGFVCSAEGGRGTSEVVTTAPYWRSDIRLAEDLVEEVARIIGYDQIPTTMLHDPIPRHNPAPILGLKEQASRLLAGYGFSEIITFVLTSLKLLTRLLPEPRPLDPAPIRLSYPMSADQEYLRPNLRANLLAALAANQRFETDIRLFELGKVYLPRSGDLPAEREMVSAVLCGSRGKSWHGDDGEVDFYDAKGIAEGFLYRFGLEARFEEGQDPSLSPAKQAAVVIAGTRVGVVGELHPRVAQSFELSGAVYLLELDLSTLVTFSTRHREFQPLPRFPAITRDIALVLDSEIAHQKIVDIISGFPLVARIALFDVYTGEQVPRGKKSLAYRLTFQSPNATLTDEQVDGVLKQVLDKLSHELGATLRAQ